MHKRSLRRVGFALACVTATACSTINGWVAPAAPAPPAPASPDLQPEDERSNARDDDGAAAVVSGEDATVSEATKRAERAAVPASPSGARPAGGSADVWRRALRESGLRIVISTGHRALWLMRDAEILFSAPVAVGMQEGFTYAGRAYVFETPIGRHSVLAKAPDPIWTPPDWHYYEFVIERGLEPVQLTHRSRIALGDGSRIEVRGEQVGRVNRFGNFAPFTPGSEIIFDGKIFIPPFGTAQRRIPEILGTRKLELGDGYLIHGTNQENSIGGAVSHGCVRMYNEDVEWLYERVTVGTPVWVY